jgi:hypothetical protein
VPLALSGDTEIAEQFNQFTRLLVEPAATEVPSAGPAKKGLLNLDRIASMW